MRFRLVCVLVFVVSALALPNATRAEGIMQWSVGVKGGGLGLAWLEADSMPPGLDAFPLFDGSRAGWGYGGGVFWELRLFEYLAFEMDLFFFHHVIKEDSSLSGGAGKSEERLEWTTIQTTLLVKGVLPVGMVRLWLGTGPEFAGAITSEATFEMKRGAVAADTVTFSTKEVVSVYWTVAMGIAIEVGPVSIPIELRFNYNLTQPAAWDGRIDATWSATPGGGGKVAAEFRTEDSLSGGLLVGVAYEF